MVARLENGVRYGKSASSMSYIPVNFIEYYTTNLNEVQASGNKRFKQ
jgi:hypothetical protein